MHVGIKGSFAVNWPPRWLMLTGIVVYGTLAGFSMAHPHRSISGDSPEYLRLSHDFGDQTFRLPGYPLFLRACGSVANAIAIQCVIGIFLIALAWHFFYEMGGSEGAIVATIFLCFEFCVVMHQRMILSESIFLPVLMAAVGFGIENPLRASVFFGLLTMIHPTGLIAMLVFLGVCFFTKRESMLKIVLISFALPLAWIARNYFVTGHMVYTSDAGAALLLCPGRAVEPSLDLLATTSPGKMALIAMAHHPIGTIKYFILSAAHLLVGTAIDMLFVLPYKPHGLMDLLAAHPFLWPLQLAIWAWLLAGYTLFAYGLSALWNNRQRDQAIFLAVSTAVLLASGSIEGYYRWRIPMEPYLAMGIAAFFSAPMLRKK
jgi:hypothetical protein